MPPRIPTLADFASLSTSLPHALHFPSPPESTTAILILFHGLGDSETPFASFAQSVNLPGVLAISVRGTAPLPALLLSSNDTGAHWGDDLAIDQATGDVDPDPGFERAGSLVMKELVQGVLIGKCGWDLDDIIIFGFGQGGSLALSIASQLRNTGRVVDVTNHPITVEKTRLKGIVSIGGPLPPSAIPTISIRDKSTTPVLLCQLDRDAIEYANKEFSNVKTVNWKRRDVGMPQNREEMFPIMKFFADCINI